MWLVIGAVTRTTFQVAYLLSIDDDVIATAVTAPEAKVSAPTAEIAVGAPKASVSTPAESAPRA